MLLAARLKRVVVGSVLAAAGADVGAAGHNGETPLHRAASSGCPDFVQLLLCLGANVNSEDASGRTPRDWALLYGRSEIEAQLVRAGAGSGGEEPAVSYP